MLSAKSMFFMGLAIVLSGCVTAPLLTPADGVVELRPGDRIEIRVSAASPVDPEPGDDPEIPKATRVQVLDSWERPEFASESEWRSETTRTLLDGQVASVILRAENPCELIGSAALSVLVPHEIAKPSAPSYQAGTYYDPLRTLDADTCAEAKYLQLDVSETVQVGDARISIVKKSTSAPATPSIPLHVEFNNWNMIRGYCGGYCKAEAKAKDAAKLLNAHRISPYKHHAADTLANWQEYTLPFTLGAQSFVGFNAVPPQARSLPQSVHRPWAYVIDEPTHENEADTRAWLRAWRDSNPAIERMVTTPLRRKDLNPQSSTYGKVIPHLAEVRELIDIYAPVAEEFCEETWPGSRDFYPCREEYTEAGKKLWLYVSNMSHQSHGGDVSGAPDLVIDAQGGAVEAFGFFLLGLKYEVDALLYYNSIEAWERQDVWTNTLILGGHGDGLLLYPDKAKREALPSMRLKLIREASQWADTIRAAGLVSEAAELMVSPKNWNRDLSKFEELHRRAMKELK